MHSRIPKVFGIISYFPDPDTDYHKFVRNQRTARCTKLLRQLNNLWPDVDILIIAQNWQDYSPPAINNKLSICKYPKLGILQARKQLRQLFLNSGYDYLIMLDDDADIKCPDPVAYLRERDNHPGGIGVIRHADHSLQLLAISKAVYSRIPMPEIDVELGHGFEGAVFVSQCFAQFPEVAFDFVTQVSETSYKDRLLPSTWLSEQTYDLGQMVYLTDALAKAACYKCDPDDGPADNSVDIVIPYVDASKPTWLSDYSDATGNTHIDTNRFRDWGTLRYLLRGIATYMPFVRDVVLLVADRCQIPDYVDQDHVRIVYHSDFIPAEYLPTFNSCTIESFLFNITKLSDQFIYFNDDIFPINTMTSADFFQNSLPRLHFSENVSCAGNQAYTNQCRSSLDLIADMLGKERYPEHEYPSPEHTATSMLKSTVRLVGEQCNEAIRSTVTALRGLKNINQYIYSYYQYYTGAYTDGVCPYLYLDIKDDLSAIRWAVQGISEIRLICLNDQGDVSDYDKIREQLLAIFEEKFPNSCVYEK